MPKTRLIDLSTLHVNHALFHHNDGTWTVRAFGVTDMGFCFKFSFDHFDGNYKTPSAALRAHRKSLQQRQPGWFTK